MQGLQAPLHVHVYGRQCFLKENSSNAQKGSHHLL